MNFDCVFGGYLSAHHINHEGFNTFERIED